MPVYTVNIKWGKKKLENIECDTELSPRIFKGIIFSLTDVPPDRQKLMVMGKLIGDDNFDGITLKNGLTLMLMGSSEPMKIDDPCVEEHHDTLNTISNPIHDEILVLPVGLNNLGNTCYMNAVVQTLYGVPELRATLKSASFKSNIRPDSESLCRCLKVLFDSLDDSKQAVLPVIFLQLLHKVCPEFSRSSTQSANEKTGHFQVADQQDANELWVELVSRLQQHVTIDPKTSNLPSILSSQGNDDESWNPISRFLTGRMMSTTTCTEGDEEVVKAEENFSQLSCFINQEVKYLHTGLRNGFEGKITKHSASLGRDAVYSKSSRITRLPAYLAVNFVRFFFKEGKNISAKILKDVKFQLTLDLYEFCSDSLKTKLDPQRTKVQQLDDLAAEAAKIERDVSKKAKKLPDPVKHMELYEPHWLPDDPGSNNTGFYDLQGVISHQGRSISSGHYVAWIKHRDAWFKFDDETVTPVSPEDILRLSGGGDWHCAYILLYGPHRVLKSPSNTVDPTTAADGTLAGDLKSMANQGH